MRVEAFEDLGKVTMDIIGLAGRLAFLHEILAAFPSSDTQCSTTTSRRSTAKDDLTNSAKHIDGYLLKVRNLRSVVWLRIHSLF